MKISIITAVYNGIDTIEECIKAVLNQSYSNIEFIIIDGCSTDGTLDALGKYGSAVRIVSEKDSGIYDALNKGIRLSSGNIVGFLHSDDLYANDNVLTKIAQAFKANPDVDCVYGDLVYVSSSDTSKIIRYWNAGVFCRDKLSNGWMPPHPTFFVKREAYERFGAFNTSFRISADYEFMMRLLNRPGITTRYIPEVLVKMRVGGASNRSIANIVRKSLEDYRIIRMHGIGGFTTLLKKNLSKVPQFFA